MTRRALFLSPVLVALLLAGCVMSGDPPPGGTPAGTDIPPGAPQGVERSERVPSAVVAPFRSMASGPATSAAPSESSPIPAPRSIQRLRRPAPVDAFSPAGPLQSPHPPGSLDRSPWTLSPAASPAGSSPRAPSVLLSFDGLLDDLTIIPPDTMGAAGPNHLVSFLNSEIGFFSKSGGPPVSRDTLSGFWRPLTSAVGLPADSPFDPKILYDQGAGRFVAVTLAGRLPTDPSSWVLLAVSRSSDPTAGWNTWAIPADNTGATWADFPGLGIDDNNVFATANMYDGTDTFRRSKIWRVPKGQLLPFPQAASLSWTEFTDPGFTLQPAHSFGGGSTEYFITEGNGTTTLSILAVTGAPPVLVSRGSVIVAPYPFVATSLPVAPNDNVDTGDTRILNAVYRNGRLYAAHTVANPANTRTEVAWYEIDPATSPPTLVQQGRVSDPSRFHYYPSIAVNGNGDVAIGFSGSSPSEFPGAYYTARLHSDPHGFTQPVGLLHAGADRYFKTNGLPTDPNRWGDYSATVVDPTDDLTFWTLQEYAQTGNRWGTRWGTFRVTDINAPDDVTAALTDNLTVRLTWTDLATNDNSYVVERRTGTSGAFALIATLPPDSTSYFDNTVLLAGTAYFYRVGAVSANSTAYSVEVRVAAPSPPSGGGGGGSCAIAPGGRVERSPGNAPAAFMPLLLPAVVLVTRRYCRKYRRAGTSRHPAC